MTDLKIITPDDVRRICFKLNEKFIELFDNNIEHYKISSPKYQNNNTKLSFCISWKKISNWSTIGDDADLKFTLDQTNLWDTDYTVVVIIDYFITYAIKNYSEEREYIKNIQHYFQEIVVRESNCILRSVKRKQFEEYLTQQKIEILPIDDLFKIILQYMFN